MVAKERDASAKFPTDPVRVSLSRHSSFLSRRRIAFSEFHRRPENDVPCTSILPLAVPFLLGESALFLIRTLVTLTDIG